MWRYPFQKKSGIMGTYISICCVASVSGHQPSLPSQVACHLPLQRKGQVLQRAQLPIPHAIPSAVVWRARRVLRGLSPSLGIGRWTTNGGWKWLLLKICESQFAHCVQQLSWIYTCQYIYIYMWSRLYMRGKLYLWRMHICIINTEYMWKKYMAKHCQIQL